MNIEELRKLKEKIESSKRYGDLDGLNKWDIENALEYRLTMDEIINSENTDEIIKNIENLIEKAVKYLSENDIPYDQICIYTYTSVFCEKDFVANLHEKYNKENEFNELIKDLPSKILPNYVPLEFSISLENTGTKETQIDDYDLDDDIFSEDIYVEGVIDFNKFISKMNALGYSIEFGNGECNSNNDYINSFLNSKDRNLYIKADFGRKNSIEEENNKTR